MCGCYRRILLGYCQSPDDTVPGYWEASRTGGSSPRSSAGATWSDVSTLRSLPATFVSILLQMQSGARHQGLQKRTLVTMYGSRLEAGRRSCRDEGNRRRQH